MPVQHSEFRSSVDSLFASGNEIDRRNAISRSYYAAYHHAKELEQVCQIQKHNGVKGKGGVHKMLVNKLRFVQDQPHLTNDDLKKIKRLGNWLNSGRVVRQKADYRIKNSVPKAEALRHSKTMDKFHKLADELIAAYG